MRQMNRMANSRNHFQGEAKRVLCVCSAGLLRSPTVAWVLSNEPFGFNTRAAGVSEEYALIPVDEVLLNWADEIVCMEESHAVEITGMNNEKFIPREEQIIRVLDLPDHFRFKDPELIRLARAKLLEIYIKEIADVKGN